jgi:SAM-dependent methyltransferase
MCEHKEKSSMKKDTPDAFDYQPHFYAERLRAEMAQLQETRRQEQPYFLMQGVSPGSARTSDAPYILSVVCGSKGWLCDLPGKNLYRHLQHIDESQVLIEYARAFEWVAGIEEAESKLHTLLDWTNTLPSATFDLVHLSYIASYTPTSAFPQLFNELVRLLRPGGIIRWDEGELPRTTSPACEQLVVLILQTLQAAERGFAPLGCSPAARNLTITLGMRNSLQTAGCQSVRHVPVVIPVSAHSTAHLSFCSQLRRLARQVRPLLLAFGELTGEEFADLYTQLDQELQANLFHGTCYLHTFWGKK